MHSKLVATLLSTSALASCLVAGAAAAQTGGGDTLGEVVVTATRRADTVHNIPLTVQAITTEQVDRQGLKSAQDIARIVPALRIGSTNGNATANVSIRGIQSGTGAPTSGVYVDDVPLQQRNLSSPTTGGGVVFPQLFDLERVEVLKGPQGTLYGGSSEGGTVRFITPAPSFTKYSANVRAEVAHQEDGDPNYELGIAVGGPIVADKLAFRIAAWARNDGGWIDHVSRFSGKSIADDTNDARHRTLHLQLAWKPTERSTITFGYFHVGDEYKDVDSWWEDIPQYQANVGPPSPATPNGRFFTYGPYKFGPYTTGMNTNIGDQFYTSDAQLKPLLQPHQSTLRIPSITMDYAFDKMNVKLISAFTDVRNRSTPDFSYVDVPSRAGTPLYGATLPGFPAGGFNALPNASPFIANLPLYTSVFDQTSVTRALTEELRFSSNDPDSNLSWVAGIFFNHTRLKSTSNIVANFADLSNLAAGSGAIPFGNSPRSNPVLSLLITQALTETQLAGYGEATYKIDDHWRVTGGIRYTRDTFSFLYKQGGPIFGTPLNPLGVIANGSVTESPITPKVGLQYVVDENTNFYANAAKGFRPGGVNGNPSTQPACTAQIAAAGYPNGAPTTYGSDSLWSYEGGVKTRAFGGRASLNASVFRIDWKGVQTSVAFPCGTSFTTNAAQVRNQGFDLDAAFRLFPGFTVSGALAYTDSKYLQDLRSSPTTLILAKGDRLANVPKWSGSVSAQYNFDLAGHRTYMQADYQYQGGVRFNYNPLTVNYAPDNNSLPHTDFVSARAGIQFNKLDISVFVQNLTNSQDLLSHTGLAGSIGRNSCLNGGCTAYLKNAVGAIDTSFRPRTWGITATYRY